MYVVFSLTVLTCFGIEDKASLLKERQMIHNIKLTTACETSVALNCNMILISNQSLSFCEGMCNEHFHIPYNI